MARDIPPKFRRQGTAVGRANRRHIATTCLIALFATGIWWVILDFGGRAVGYPMGANLLWPVLAGIFLLLVLGLSMAAMATSGNPNGPERTKQDGVAEAPDPRRKVG